MRKKPYVTSWRYRHCRVSALIATSALIHYAKAQKTFTILLEQSSDFIALDPVTRRLRIG